MVRAVVPPTVPEGTARVRVCLHAGNTEGDVGKLVESLGVWSRSYVGDGDGEVPTVEKRGGNEGISARL